MNPPSPLHGRLCCVRRARLWCCVLGSQRLREVFVQGRVAALPVGRCVSPGNVWEQVDGRAGTQGVVDGALEDGAVVAAGDMVRCCWTQVHVPPPCSYDVALQLDIA
jgi:hypothetical protein